MKTSILHLLSLFLIVAFTASCGKSESGAGKSGAADPIANPIEIPAVDPLNLNASGEAAYITLKNWYATADSTPVGTNAYFLKVDLDASKVSFDFYTMCMPGIPGIPGCTAPSACFIRTNIGVQPGRVVMEGSEGRRYKECDITSAFSLYQKTTDQNLKDTVLGKTGLHVIPSLTKQTGGIFEIFYASTEGGTIWTKSAEINTTLPAFANPTRTPKVGSMIYSNLIDYRLH